MGHIGSSARISMLVVFTGLMALPSLASAASGWYAGVAMDSMTTTLDYTIGTESYSTQHVGVKLGYEFSGNSAIEFRLMGAGNGTDVDFLGDTYRWDSGTIFSVYWKPSFNTSSRTNIYGLLGVSTLSSRYQAISPVVGPVDSESVFTFDMGVGLQYNFNRFTLSTEVKGRFGAASYSAYFTGDPITVTSLGIGIAAHYRF